MAQMGIPPSGRFWRMLRGFALAVVLATTVSATPTSLGAQEDTAASQEVSPQAIATAQPLVGRMQPLLDTLAVLASQLPEATVEQRAVLLRRAERRRADLADIIQEFMSLAPDIDRSSPSGGALVAEVVSVLTEMTDLQEGLIRSVWGEMEVATQARDTVSLDALAGFEEAQRERAKFMDGILPSYQRNLQRLEELGEEQREVLEALDDFLLERAEGLAARIDYGVTSVRQLREAIRSAGDAGAPDAEVRLPVDTENLDQNLESLSVLVDLLDARGFDTSDYRQVLLLSGGGLSVDILRRDVAVGLVGRAMEAGTTWLTTNGVTLLFRAVVFFLILALFWVLGRFARRVVRRGLERSNLRISNLLRQTLVTWTGRVVLLLGLLIALAQMGVNLAPVLAGLGVAGFVVGFALQETLANFAAGVMILFYRPFDVEDVVEAGGVFGKVASMSLVSTTILSFDNQRLVVPNAKIWGEVIRNVTAEHIRRVDLTFGISYRDDIPKAEEILHRVFKEHPKTLDDPEPLIKVHSLGDSSVNLILRPWCKTEDYWDVFWDLTRTVKMTFDAEGISIPFPQRDVHLYGTMAAPSEGSPAPGADLPAGPKDRVPDPEEEDATD
jgi:small conductance mechanosensitive channel